MWAELVKVNKQFTLTEGNTQIMKKCREISIQGEGYYSAWAVVCGISCWCIEAYFLPIKNSQL